MSKRIRVMPKEYPEMDFWMNESACDVVFVIEEQRIPALKHILSFKNIVFRAMFKEKNFKEANAEEVVIKDTTYEAFKTLIWFLYTEKLDLKDNNDFQLMEEVYKLSDRYEAPRLRTAIVDHLRDIELTLDNYELMIKIVFTYKMEELMPKTKAFLKNSFNHFVDKDINALKELNDRTDGQLLEVMTNNYRKQTSSLYTLNSTLKTRDIEIETLNYKLKSLNQEKDLKERYRCKTCDIIYPFEDDYNDELVDIGIYYTIECLKCKCRFMP